MERHRIDENDAFALLREQARRNGRKLVDIAQAVIDGHRLLPAAIPADNPRALGDDAHP
jgi:response regulator NasT